MTYISLETQNARLGKYKRALVTMPSYRNGVVDLRLLTGF
jgi:hypothetical protein